MRYIRNVTVKPYKTIKRADTKYIPTGFSTDDYTDDLMSRKITILTSQSEEGKSVILHRILLNAIDKGFKVLLVDGEYDEEELIRELYLKIIGKDKSLYDLTKPNKVYIKEPKKHILKMIEQWHENKLHILSKTEANFHDFEAMFNEIVEYVKTEKIDLVCLDNMMSLVSSSQAERNAAQADFIKNIILLNRKYNCHSVVVNHARKQAQRGIELDIFDMSGTSDMANSCDNVFVVWRNFDPADDEPDGWLSLKKNKLNGKHKTMPLIFDHENRTYLEVISGVPQRLSLNWRNEGKQEWIKSEDTPF